ncbi:unnamed protein product, partial [Owenia fusiformis]
VLIDAAPKHELLKLDRLHYKAALIVSGCIKGTNTNKVLKILNWAPLSEKRKQKKLLLMHDVYYENAPPYISNIFNLYRNKRPTRALRKTPHFIVPAKQSEKTRRGTVVSSISEWERDTLPDQLKTIPIKRTFKYHLKKHLFPKKTLIDTVHLNLDRQAEIVLNKTRCDFIFRYHKFQHQFNNVNPQCLCGFRSQTTQHLFFSCPLLLDLREQL